ncbi:phosphonate-transporting ATPase [Arthrobacter crystallopoietes BAB-32]|uniref:Phosphonate-transporting ATPase n=1 Tax=Arthrobacter crystallopoietes BAB-32 TaxID=1246476 RepID=N1V1A3_9MICC|nr:metal ABC transporter ATP-binding protein [Arthrobacter crystallopoietes]EMY35120.1 phosphonate-transporting ATPase [Arthrobacter crystallopoietes BAB-32]
MAVSVRGLRVELGGSLVLDGVDASVRQGKAVAILGANGSGKSTLVKSLVGLVPVTAGEVEIFGAAGKLPWSRIGYVPQRMGAGSGVPATAAEVVASGLLDNRRLRPGRGARRRSLEALEGVGLADRASASVQVLSGGQQQRVLIARALIREPDLLIMDEPLAGMDQESREALARTLAGLQDRGATVLLVLHELGELTALIRRTLVLEEGRIAYDGPARLPGSEAEAEQDRHAHPASSWPGPAVAGTATAQAPDLSRKW